MENYQDIVRQAAHMGVIDQKETEDLLRLEERFRTAEKAREAGMWARLIAEADDQDAHFYDH